MTIPAGRLNRDQEAYRENPTDGGVDRRVADLDSHEKLDLINENTVDFCPISKIDIENSLTTYYGRTRDETALTSEAKWQIWRVTTNGQETTTLYANNGAFDQIWDDRATIFPAETFYNNFSTQFDGINDRVNFGNNLTYDIGVQWSLSLWFKANNLAARKTLWSKCQNSGSVYGIGIYLLETTGGILIQTRAPSAAPNLYSVATFSAGVWNNFTLTYSGSGNQSGYRLYFNGVVDSTPASATLASIVVVDSAYLGLRGTSFPFSGQMDELSFWSKELSAADVSELYNSGSPTNLLNHSASSFLDHYYRLGDGDVDPTVLDHAGSVNGTLENGATFVADVP